VVPTDGEEVRRHEVVGVRVAVFFAASLIDSHRERPVVRFLESKTRTQT